MSNTLTYNCNVWYTSRVKSQCMADEPHEVGISLKCSKNLFFGTCNALWPQYRFFNIVHLSAIVRHVNYTFLHCFSTYLQLEMAISACILIFAHIFCLCMFLINHGCSDMACQMNSLPPWGGISLIWFKNPFLQYVYFCMPQNISFSVRNFVGTGSHMIFLFPCHYSIHFYIYMLISVYMFILLHMFLSENGWNRSWVK